MWSVKIKSQIGILKFFLFYAKHKQSHSLCVYIVCVSAIVCVCICIWNEVNYKIIHNFTGNFICEPMTEFFDNSHNAS